MIKFKKEKGVSEVIGTLLILTITVILFSSVFYYVATMPPPKSQVYASFQASYSINNEGFANITITNVGGESLNANTTNILFIFTNNSGTFTATHPLSDFIKQLKSGYWTVGQSIFYSSSIDNVHLTYLSGITIYIIDKISNSIVWQDILSGKGVQSLKITGFSYTPVPIRNSGLATFNAFVIYNPSGSIPSVIIDLRSLGLGTPNMNYAGPFQFTYSIIPQNLNPGSYPVWINATQKVNSTLIIAQSYKAFVNVGTTASQVLNISSIKLSSYTPVYSSSIKITVNVYSTALQPENFQLLFKDIYNGQTSVIKSIDISGNPTSQFLVYPYNVFTYTTTWSNVGSGNAPEFGPHQLQVDIINTSPPVQNGSFTVNFTVLPRILVVDGENVQNQNLISYYSFDLSADDYQYTVLPASNVNSLSSYDVVIWIEHNYNINTNQIAMIQTFLNNGGKLWFIDPNGTYAGIFNLQTQTSNNYYNNIIAQSGDINLNLPNGSIFSPKLNNWNKVIISSNNNYKILFENGYGNPVAIYGNSGNGKIIYFSFEFSTITPIYLQNFLSYKLINWFCGMKSINVPDLAIADLIVSNYHPLYHKPVNITVAIRNNGPAPLKNIPVNVYIDNQLLIETKDNSMVTWNLNGAGSFTLLANYTWIASTPGIHTLYVVVDPNNLFNEPNMNNNMLSENYIFPGSINVQFSTLIVGNDTNFANIKSIISTFQALNYSYTFYNESNIRTNSTYPNGEYFSQFNLVIWEGGSNSNALGSSNSLDVKALINYMTNYNGSVLFLGSNIGNAISNSNYNNVPLSSTLGISYSSYSSGNWIIFGLNYNNGGDQITRGMDLIYSGATESITISSGTALFYYSPVSTSTPISQLLPYYYKISNVQNKGIGVKGNYGPAQFAILPLDYSGIKGILREVSDGYAPWNPSLQAQSWLMFMMLKWFGLKDMRTQFSINSVDINVIGNYGNTVTPIIQHSYVISANISNLGYTGQSVLIQFYQDYDIIGSQTVYIPGNSYVTVQMLWTPLFAGSSRSIIVYIDPNNQLTQINTNGTYSAWGKLFNFLNEGIRTYTIYYFWDNMNNGPGNWNTETTILNINGEGPFSFMSGTNINTNVIYNINTTLSKNYEITQNFSYSPPNSYYLREVVSTGTVSFRPPLDIAFVIDFSGSMANPVPPSITPKYQLVQKAFSSLIQNQTGPNDRVTVFIFSSDDLTSYGFTPIAYLYSSSWETYSIIYQNSNGFMYMNNTNKKILINDLKSASPGGYTPFWSTLGLATNYVLAHSRPSSVARSAIIAMTDGDDNGVWMGSPYSPLGIWNQSFSFSSSTIGGFTKYELSDPANYQFFDQYGNYITDTPWYYAYQNNWVKYSGYNYAYTNFIKPGVPPMKGLLFAPIPIFTIGIGVLPYNYLYNNTKEYNSPLNWTEQKVSSDNGISFYMSASGDLWNVAWSTGARYFYTATGTDLPQIFSAIVQLIGTSPGGSVLAKLPPTLSRGFSTDSISPNYV
ncbi:MAG: type IV pilin, partial [Thermoplasmata archaeon]